MLDVMKIRVLKHKLSIMKHNFTAGANPENYIDGTPAEMWEKYQHALKAVENFDFDNQETSFAELKKVWFPVNKFSEDEVEIFERYLVK